MANPTTTPFIPPLPLPRSRTPEAPRPLGVSTDYTGYPVLGATRPQSAPPSASPSHPPFPTSTPTDPTALPWNTTEQSHPYPYLQQQPMAPGMYHPPPVWGHGDFMPGHGMAVDPYRGVPLGFWPYPMQQPQAQRRVNIGDRLDPFMAGNHYGPVLEPFLLRVVGAQIRINPLIQPPSDDDSDRPHLQWDMLFPSSRCRKSTDDPRVSWHSGRHEPATFPRITFMRIVSEAFSWILFVHAKDLAIGVTCGEVIDTLGENFSRLSSGGEYNELPPQRQKQVSEAYSYNRSTAFGVPGDTLGQGMRRLDFLCKDAMYGGVVVDEAVLRKVCEYVLPCTFVLNCSRRPALTQNEIRER